MISRILFCCIFALMECLSLNTGWAVNNAVPIHQATGKGVLVVTYHTGRNGERLDRVRFRLINEQKEQTMYPRASTFDESSNGHTRRVTIPNLPVGRYSIEFIVPNSDGLFADIPQRQITIGDGDIVKIDQTFKPHYARVKATAMVPEDTGQGPVLRLTDRSGKVIAAAYGELVTTSLLPGRYTLHFDAYRDYVPPNPIHFEVGPGAAVGPFERHYNKRVINKSTFLSDVQSYLFQKLMNLKRPPPLMHPRQLSGLVRNSSAAYLGSAVPEQADPALVTNENENVIAEDHAIPI